MNENHDEKGQFASGGGATYSGKSGNLQGRLAQQKANLAKAASKPTGKGGKAAKAKMQSATNSTEMKAAHAAMDKNTLAAHEHAAIDAHHQALTAAGTDKAKFDAAFKGMKLNKAQATVLAHKYTSSVTNYKTIKAAKEDIQKGFIRNVRFANKIA